MLHPISVLFWILLQPSSLLMLAAAIGLLLVSRGHLTWGLRALWATAATTAFLVFTPVADWLLQPLEDRFPRPALSSDPGSAPKGIIVLGGSEDARIAVARNVVALNEAGERLIEAAMLARRYPNAPVILSGGSAALLRDLPPEAETAARVLEGLGIARSRLILEGRSRNTGENARFTADLGVVKSGDRWLLITSAWHMPRAVATFRNVGLDVTPFPVDYRTEPRFAGSVSVRNAPESLRKFDYVAREWVGLLAYRLTGRSKALLPSP